MQLVKSTNLEQLAIEIEKTFVLGFFEQSVQWLAFDAIDHYSFVTCLIRATRHWQHHGIPTPIHEYYLYSDTPVRKANSGIMGHNIGRDIGEKYAQLWPNTFLQSKRSERHKAQYLFDDVCRSHRSELDVYVGGVIYRDYHIIRTITEMVHNDYHGPFEDAHALALMSANRAFRALRADDPVEFFNSKICLTCRTGEARA